jgi:RND family efflux transporter MFP subunit
LGDEPPDIRDAPDALSILNWEIMPLCRPQLTTTIVAVLALFCEVANSQPHSIKVEDTLTGPQGVLEPWRTSEVACSETGLLHQVFVKLGDRVEVGDRLAELKSDSIRLQLQMAETQVSAVGRIETAQAEVELNVRKVAAITEARKNNFSSQMELERAEMDSATARGRLKTEIEERAVLELRAAQLRQVLQDRLIVAPIAGQVTMIHREAGELVAANAPEIVRIVDVSKLRSRFYLTEQEVKSLGTDRSVTVELANGNRVRAMVEDIAPVADKESGLIVVSVLIDNLNSDIRSSRCTLLIGKPTL